MNLVDLETFMRVAEAGSITKAARLLGVPKSTVSRRVARLEDAVSADLLQRAGRSVALTEQGRSLHRRCAHALQEIVDAGKTIGTAGGEVRGLIRLTAPPDLGGSPSFARLITGFRARYPAVSFELELTTRVVDLIEEGYDAALRVHLRPLPDTNQLKAKRLGAVSSRLYASPDYLVTRAAPRRPEELPAHSCVALSHLPTRSRWTLRSAAGQQAVHVEPQLLVSDYVAALKIVLAGGGVGVLPTFIATPHVREGRLVRVLPAWDVGQGTLSLVWPVARYMAPKLRALVDFVQREADEGSLFAEA